jgi:two-component system cell cycle response regulator
MEDRFDVLWVDSSPMGGELERALFDAGASVRSASTAAQAISLLMDMSCDLAVVAVDLEGESGLAVLQHVRADEAGTPVILTSRTDDAAARADAFLRGADDYLVKPLRVVELLARMHRRRELHQQWVEIQQEAARLYELAVTDGLTQVANHRHFQDRLREEFRRAQRYDDPLGLILVDLDHFKTLNDTFGHQMGDQVLVAVANAVKVAVRETDFVARYGGEEFAVILPNTHLAGALTVAERITDEMAKIQLKPGLRVTGSFGLSGFPGRSVTTPHQLIGTADQALYRAKREGRNRISLFQATHPTLGN